MYIERPIAVAFRTARRGAATAGVRRAAPTGSLLRAAFYFSAALCETGAILASAMAAGLAYHWMFYNPEGMAENFLVLGCAIAFLFVIPGIVRDEYALTRFVNLDLSLRRVFVLWSVAFLSAILLAFLSKTSADASRGTMALFYVLGFGALSLVRAGFARLARRVVQLGGAAARRVFLVGSEDELTRFSARYQPATLGFHVVAAHIIRDARFMRDDLALAAASARLLRPEDVIILLPWAETRAIEACVDAFMRVPASIHLGPERVLDRFADARIDRAGPIASLRLVRRPLTTLEVGLKRAMDLLLASLGLLVLAPFLALIWLSIRLESPGPALFTQRRYGFNQEPFRIFKFRSMTVTEDGRDVRHARAGDPRVTTVGAFLRRWSLDELPQLFNVIRGDMSLVGPRPHALVHDQQFERTIALYARRHNVKPGMTGWAQVNGHRGGVTTDEQIRQRVTHDLYYSDQWSM